MIKDGDKLNKQAPAKVRAGDRPKASTINSLIDAVGAPRVIRENKMAFRQPSKDIYPLQVINDPASSTKVAIRGGLVDVIKDGVTLISMSIGSAGDFTGTGSLPTELATMAGTLSVSTTYWVYVVASIAGTPGELAQCTTLEGYIVSGSRPTTIYQPQAIKILAKIVVDSLGNRVITPEWTGGNIKIQANVPDSIDGYNLADGEIMKSLGYDSFGRANIYNFHAAGTVLGEVPYCWIDSGATENRTLKWRYPNEVGGSGGVGLISITGIAKDISLSNQTLSWQNEQYDVTDGLSNFKTQGSGTESLDLGGAMDYWWLNGSHAEYHTALEPDPLGVTPGVAWSANADHDSRYWANFGLAGRDIQSYYTEGTVDAYLFSMGDRAGNTWQAIGFEVDVTGALNLDAGDNSLWAITGTLGLSSTGILGLSSGAAVDITAGATSAWDVTGNLTTTTSGTLNHTSDGGEWLSTLDLSFNDADNGTNTVRFGDNGKSWHTFRVNAQYIYLAATSAIYYDSSTIGVSITNWTTNGGVTGTLVEKEFQNVSPTDKVLVRV